MDSEAEGHIVSAGIPLEVFPYLRPLVKQNETFRQGLAQKATAHSYSLITFETEDAFTVFNETVCKDCGYKCIDKIELQLGLMTYEVQFYALENY